MVETSISWLLKQNQTINDTLEDRVTPFFRDNDEDYPAVTYQKTGFYQERLMDNTLSSIAEHNIDMDVWATSYVNVKTLSEQIKNHLLYFNGNANGTQIDLIKFTGENEDVEADPDRYLVTLKFTFYTNEA